MALINCPECSEDVSDSAYKCPKCGVELRKLTRSFMGKIIKWGFILFNLFMAYWMVVGMQAATENIGSLSGAEATGAAIGTGFGAAMIGGIWFVGVGILGILVLLTRPKA